jgi:hypothetical protein
VDEVAYHRNGICGEGFHVVLFRWPVPSLDPRPMVGIVFPGAGQVAVLDRRLLAEGAIQMAEGNAWRGDHFEAELRRAIRAQRREDSVAPPA